MIINAEIWDCQI